MSAMIKVGLISYGYGAKTFHAKLIEASGMTLELIASSDAAKVHADYPNVRVTNDYRAAATDSAVNLVVIASPNDSHFSLACAALDAGKDVVVDKPFTVTVDEALELVRRADHAKRFLSVFHNRRFYCCSKLKAPV